MGDLEQIPNSTNYLEAMKGVATLTNTLLSIKPDSSSVRRRSPLSKLLNLVLRLSLATAALVPCA